MNNIELVKYEEFPNDPYTKAVAVLCVDGKYNVSFGKKSAKDGSTYWAAPSFGCASDSGSKEYYEGFSMDSKKEDQKFKDFIKGCEDKLRGNSLKLTKSDVPFIQRGVADEQGMPF